MTINQAIDAVDQERPNAYSEATKRRWLEQMDMMAWRDVFATHADCPAEPAGYDEETDGETELLLPDDFKNVYVYWLMAMIDYTNQETTRYTNDMIMFNTAYSDFEKYWNRNHMPRGRWIKGANTRVRR